MSTEKTTKKKGLGVPRPKKSGSGSTLQSSAKKRKDLHSDPSRKKAPLDVKIILSVARGDTRNLAYVYDRDGAMALVEITSLLCGNERFVEVVNQITDACK